MKLKRNWLESETHWWEWVWLIIIYLPYRIRDWFRYNTLEYIIKSILQIIVALIIITLAMIATN